MDLSGKKHVFVYGTLMKGMGNEHVIASFPHENFPATVSNVDMFNVGSFPALVKGTHSYHGELVVFDPSVDETMLYAYMDRLEGYHKDRESESMYLRVPITVCVNGEQVETEVYLWNYSLNGLKFIDPAMFKSYREFVAARNW